MNDVTEFLSEARIAYRRRDWAASYGAFGRVDGLAPLSFDDLEAFAVAAWWRGHGSEAARLTERVYRGLARTDLAAAAMKAVQLGLQWHARGHVVPARQWTERARVLLADGSGDRLHGLVAYLDVLTAFATGASPASAVGALRDNATATGDVTLAVLARAVDGMVALLEARTIEGQKLLDQLLLPSIDERVPMEWAQDVYRVAVQVGARRADPGHVAAWTSALQGWRERAGVR